MARNRIEIGMAPIRGGEALIVTPEMMRTARLALGWRVPDLAAASGVSAATIYAHEARQPWGRMHRRNNDLVYRALHGAGVIFQLRQAVGDRSFWHEGERV